MKINGKWKYKWAITVTPEAMRELETLLEIYYENIRYTAYLRNKSKVDFENLDELLEYENIDGREIVEIVVYGGLDYDSTAMSLGLENETGLFVNYKSTVNASYTVKNPDDEMTLTTRLTALFNKAKSRHALIRKICLYDLLMIFLIIIAINILLIAPTSNNSKSTRDWIIIMSVSIIFAAGFHAVDKFIKKLMSPLVFYWGAQIETSKRIANTRHQIFWGVLVASAVSIVLFFITKQFT